MAIPRFNVDLADWEPLNLEWHEGYAFLDQALLGDERARDTYILVQPDSGTAQAVAQRARDGGYQPTPLAAQQPAWRHRRSPAVLRDAQRDYYLLTRYHERYGYHAVKPLPFRFADDLQQVGRGYWRDEAQVYYFSEYDIDVVDEPVPQSLHLFDSGSEPGSESESERQPGSVPESRRRLESGSESASTASNLAQGSNGFFRNGLRVGAADDAIQVTNHPHYLIINGQVCWLRYGDPLPLYQKDGSRLPIADPVGFYMLGWRWGTDGRSIIVQAQSGSAVVRIYFYVIDDADLPSFSVLNERYAMDAKHAYYVTGKIIRHAGNFRLLREWMPQFDEAGRVTGSHEQESEKIAVGDLYVYGAGIKIRGAHGPTFRHLGFGYYRDRARVYLRNKPVSVDVNTFVVAWLEREDDLRGVLAGDKDGPLGSDGIVGAADLAQWAPFFQAHPGLQGYWWHKLQGQQHKPSALLQADPAELPESLRDVGEDFALGRRVYFRGQPVEGLDPGSFELLSRHLCGDAHGLYLIPFHGAEQRVPQRFSSASAKQYQALDAQPCYLSDGATVFCHDIVYLAPKPLAKADLRTFESFGNGWAKDQRAVYYLGQAKKDLDPAKTRFAGNYAYSDSAMFVDGKRLDVEFNAEEVSVPHPGFLMLGTRKLYFGRRPISASRIDLPSLQFAGERYARDKHHWYAYDGQFGLKEISEAEYLAVQDLAAQENGKP
jgi:hypothetical protein